MFYSGRWSVMFAVQYDRLWPDPGALRWSVMFAVQYDRLWPDPLHYGGV